MYRGNMGDFVQRLNEYLLKTYSCKIIFGRIPQVPNMGDLAGYYVAFFGPSQNGAEGYQVFDVENFEDQVIDYVNEELSHVQGKHDGFSQQYPDLFGEDISGIEDEDY